MIKIFKRPGCVYCPQVMKYYDYLGVKYKVEEAEGSEYERLSQQFGFSVPLVYNDESGEGMVGFDLGRLRRLAM